jgi:hypothetical protein
MDTTTTPQPAAVVEHIDADACICGTKRRRPRPDCWAHEHDCDRRFDEAEGQGRR